MRKYSYFTNTVATAAELFRFLDLKISHFERSLYDPYILRVLSMDVEARKLALAPNRTPVAWAVWSLNSLKEAHCLHKYTLWREEQKMAYHKRDS